jgi:hypothetical protein
MTAQSDPLVRDLIEPFRPYKSRDEQQNLHLGNSYSGWEVVGLDNLNTFGRVPETMCARASHIPSSFKNILVA